MARYIDLDNPTDVKKLEEAVAVGECVIDANWSAQEKAHTITEEVCRTFKSGDHSFEPGHAKELCAVCGRHNEDHY